MHHPHLAGAAAKEKLADMAHETALRGAIQQERPTKTTRARQIFALLYAR